MKKGWKRFWVFCGVTAAVGCVCAVTGKAMGATGVLVDNYMPQFFWKSGSTSVDSDQVELFSNVKNLKVDTEGLFVNIVPCEENNVRVETYNVNSRLKLQIKEEQGELKVETTAEHYPWKLLNQEVAGEVTIQVPYYLEFGEADLQVGYGELDVEEIKAKDLNLEVGAGAGNINSFTADTAEFMVGAGSLTAVGEAGKKVDIECGVRELNYTAEGTKEDFNYFIECGIGELNLENESYSGVAVNKNIDNNAGKDMKIQCGIGSVNVSFEGAAEVR